MKPCKCGSFAINLHCHGRDQTDIESCDVCYWRNKAAGAYADGVRAAAEACNGNQLAVDAKIEILALIEKKP